MLHIATKYHPTNKHLNPILTGLLEHPILHGKGHICHPIYSTISRKSYALEQYSLAWRYCMLLPKYFRNLDPNMMTASLGSMTSSFSNFCNFLHFFQFLKFSGVFFAKLFFNQSQYYHKTMTWLCDVVREKNSSDIVLVLKLKLNNSLHQERNDFQSLVWRWTCK